MSTRAGAPSRTARIVSLALTWSFAVIATGVGLNALIKSNQSKDFVKQHAPAGVVVDINTEDAHKSGIVLTVSALILALLTFPLIILNLLPNLTFFPFNLIHKLSLTLQSILTFFVTLWMTATLIAFDIIVRQRSARVTATIGGRPLPQGLIDQQQKALGVSPVYWDQMYLRLLAIIPWITVLFGFITSALLFKASRRTTSQSNASRERVLGDSPPRSTRVSDEEKAQIEASNKV